jgi:hypothetical protein
MGDSSAAQLSFEPYKDQASCSQPISVSCKRRKITTSRRSVGIQEPVSCVQRYRNDCVQASSPSPADGKPSALTDNNGKFYKPIQVRRTSPRRQHSAVLTAVAP